MLLHCGVGEDFESPLDCKDIQPVHPKGDQSWVFIGRADVEAETAVLWPPDVKSWLIWKDPDPGKDWRWEEKGTTEDEMVGWHHWLNGHGFGWTPGVGDGQGGLACCGSWGWKESDTTEWLNWTELFILLVVSFVVQKLLSRSHLFIFAFVSFASGDRSKKLLLHQKVFCLYFLLILWFWCSILSFFFFFVQCQKTF